MPPRYPRIEEVCAKLRELACDGYAPSQHVYNRHRGDLIATSSLLKRGHSWRSLAIEAGLRPARRGLVGTQHTARDERLDIEIQRMAAAAEPARPSTWPLFGIHTRTVVRERQVNGALMRTTYEYYSLR